MLYLFLIVANNDEDCCTALALEDQQHGMNEQREPHIYMFTAKGLVVKRLETTDILESDYNQQINI